MATAVSNSNYENTLIENIGEIMETVKVLNDFITQKEADFFCTNLLVKLKKPDSTSDKEAIDNYKKKKVESNAEVDMVISGSSMEGFELRDLIIEGKRCSLKHINQDCDFMCVYKNFKVYEMGQNDGAVFVRLPCDSSPGFSHIKKVGHLEGNIMDSIFEQCLDETRFLRNSKILNMSDEISLDMPRKEQMQNLDSFQSGPAMMIDVYGGMEFKSIDLHSDHGQSDLVQLLKAMDERKKMTTPEQDARDNLEAKYKSADFVIAFPLNSWPSESDEFFMRKRPTSWPTKQTLEELQSTDCFLVCVGSHLSDNESKEREFRLSFSKAEIVIANSLSKEQRHCYQWAKMMLKLHLSNPKVLSSYHLKTLFFWFCEKVPKDQFMSDTMPNTFFQFFEYVIEACKKHEINNYFVSSNNMIGHFSDTEVQEFLSRMEKFQETLIEKMMYVKSDEAVKTYTMKETLADVHLRLSRGLFDDEKVFWKYVLYGLHGYEFSDEDTEALHRAAQEYGKMHPHFLKDELHL